MLSTRNQGTIQTSSEETRIATLRALAARGDNVRCLECLQRGPTYVDVTLGSFVCSRCSGLLRGLTPPHRVKSISMSTFTDEEINLVKSSGNEFCRSVWLGLYEGEQPMMKDEQHLKDFLSDKYEKKRYYVEPKFSEKVRCIREILMPVPPLVSRDPPRSNIVLRPMSRATESSTLITPALTVTTSSIRSTNNISSSQNTSNPSFHVDFASADIFNSSQFNNNVMSPPPVQSSFANFDNRSTNTISHDKYAALADLDFTFRQQNQSQIKDDNIKSSSSFNPFDNNFFTNTKNPFYSNNSNINGSSIGYSNPFTHGSNGASTGQSKNPFL